MSEPGPPAQPQTETILALIGLIYDSVADASRWPSFLEAFVSAIRGRKATLSLRDSEHLEFTMATWFGWSDDDVRVYVERYASNDPWRVGSARSPEGVVGTDEDACPREEMEPSAAFREYYAPRDAIHGIGATILRTDTGHSTIVAVRGAKDGPFGDVEKAILLPLLPHLRRAALLHGELGSLRSQLAAFTSHLDRYPHSVVLTDVESRVLYANAAAREIADLKDGLVMEAGRIVLTSRKLEAAFQQAVAKMATDHDAPLLRLEVPRPSRKQPYRLVLMPVQASGFIPLGVALPAVTVLIIDSESQPEPDPAVLGELFALTPAEARIAGKLVQGRSVEEIAGEAGISVETVRTHLKRILSKTSTARQCELIALVLRSVPFRRT
jgi:DNA-binding CsgD family transcriptional regulator